MTRHPGFVAVGLVGLAGVGFSLSGHLWLLVAVGLMLPAGWFAAHAIDRGRW